VRKRQPATGPKRDQPESAGAPFFSVVMNAYNSARTLPRAVGSVLGQGIRDFELVVVDDGSTDETPALLDSYAADPRVRVIRQENAKCAAARQAGIVAARGEHVVFLDSDDEARPHWLAAFREVLQETGADVVCAGVTVMLPNRRSTVRMPEDHGPGLKSITGLFLSGAFAIRRTVLLGAGGYAAGTEPVDHTDFLHRLADYAERIPVAMATVMREVVTIHREEAVPYPPQLLLKGALHLLRTYPEHFQRDPRATSLHLSIAGVNAFRAGDLAQARRHFREACSATPWNAKCRARSLTASIPGLASLVWGIASQGRGEAS
jgi:hypothetical protein